MTSPASVRFKNLKWWKDFKISMFSDKLSLPTVVKEDLVGRKVYSLTFCKIGGHKSIIRERGEGGEGGLV